MVNESTFTIRLFNFVFVGIAVDAENFVVVLSQRFFQG